MKMVIFVSEEYLGNTQFSDFDSIVRDVREDGSLSAFALTSLFFVGSFFLVSVVYLS